MDDKPVMDAFAEQRALFTEALRRGDAHAASSFYASEAHVLAPSTRPIVGRDDIRAFWQAGIDAGVVDVALNAEGAHQSDGLAYETGEYEFKVGAGDSGRVVERGHYLQVYRRQGDGTWQRAVEMFTPQSGPMTGGSR